MYSEFKGKLLIFSAPSGAGKSTIVNHLMTKFPQLAFSISATSRKPRKHELHGKEYYFLDRIKFERTIEMGEFLEWEEVYPGQYYGTLKLEVDRLWSKDKVVIFDLDVKGGINLKKQFGADALAVFVSPPSLEELERRLIARQTESKEQIEVRMKRARAEMDMANQFDHILFNKNLDQALKEAEELVHNFLKS
ncbi:MAG TPA: guanylate kinase [Flavobacteriales bacterium]|jgi:guanylate kinase|nr:guanylate kinase [Flavobacteriales bacterium]